MTRENRKTPTKTSRLIGSEEQRPTVRILDQRPDFLDSVQTNKAKAWDAPQKKEPKKTISGQTPNPAFKIPGTKVNLAGNTDTQACSEYNSQPNSFKVSQTGTGKTTLTEKGISNLAKAIKKAGSESNKQDDILYANTTAPLLIEGPSGSGKTILTAYNLLGKEPYRRVALIKKPDGIRLIVIRSNTNYTPEKGQNLRNTELPDLIFSLAEKDEPTLWLIDGLLDTLISDPSSFSPETSKNLTSLNRGLRKKNSVAVYTTQDKNEQNRLKIEEILTEHTGIFKKTIWKNNQKTDIQTSAETLLEPGKQPVLIIPSDLEKRTALFSFYITETSLLVCGGTGKPKKTYLQKNTKAPIPLTRREASDLARNILAEMRVKTPKARLFEAYNELAKRHGYQSWHVMSSKLQQDPEN